MRKFSGSDSSAALTSSSVIHSRASSSALRPMPLVATAHAAEEVELLDVVELGLLRAALARPVGVDERVREDAVEPRLEVRARLEAAVAAVGLQVGLLHQVLGVRGVARHPERGGVQRAHELDGVIRERLLISHESNPSARVSSSWKRPRHAGRPLGSSAAATSCQRATLRRALRTTVLASRRAWSSPASPGRRGA